MNIESSYKHDYVLQKTQSHNEKIAISVVVQIVLSIIVEFTIIAFVSKMMGIIAFSILFAAAIVRAFRIKRIKCSGCGNRLEKVLDGRKYYKVCNKCKTYIRTIEETE